MVKFAKLSKVDRINFAEELAKHIATINERVLSTSSVVTYKSGKAVIKKKGDMYAIVDIIIPEKLTKEQKQLFEQLNNTSLDNHPSFKKYKNYVK